jgi:hypothetical protein
MEHYNQNSQVIEKCSSSSSSNGGEERKGSNYSNRDGDQTPTLHGSQCQHQDGSPEMVALNGLNESGHGTSAFFLVNSVESFKPPASQASDELSVPP